MAKLRTIGTYVAPGVLLAFFEALRRPDVPIERLDLAERVQQAGLVDFPQDVRELLAANDRITHLLSLSGRPGKEAFTLARQLGVTPPAVLGARLAELYETAQTSGNARFQHLIVMALPAADQYRFADDLHAAMGRRGSPQQAATAYYFGYTRPEDGRIHLDSGARDAFREIADEWIRRARKGQRADVREILRQLEFRGRQFTSVETEVLTQSRGWLSPRPRE